MYPFQRSGTCGAKASYKYLHLRCVSITSVRNEQGETIDQGDLLCTCPSGALGNITRISDRLLTTAGHGGEETWGVRYKASCAACTISFTVMSTHFMDEETKVRMSETARRKSHKKYRSWGLNPQQSDSKAYAALTLRHFFFRGIRVKPWVEPTSLVDDGPLDDQVASVFVLGNSLKHF